MPNQERRELVVADYSIRLPDGEVIPTYTRELVGLWTLDHSLHPFRQVLSRVLCRAVAGDVTPDQINFARFMRALRAQVNRPGQPEVIITSGKRASSIFGYALADDVQVHWPEGANFGPDRPKMKFHFRKGHWLYGLEELEEKILAASWHQVGDRDLAGFMQRVLGRNALPEERDKFIAEVAALSRTRLARWSSYSLVAVRKRQPYADLHIEDYKLVHRSAEKGEKEERKEVVTGSDEEAIRAACNLLIELKERVNLRWRSLTDGVYEREIFGVAQTEELLSIDTNDFIARCRRGLQLLLALQKELIVNPDSPRSAMWTPHCQRAVEMIPIIVAKYNLRSASNIMWFAGKKVHASKRDYAEDVSTTYLGPPIDGRVRREFSLPEQPVSSF